MRTLSLVVCLAVSTAGLAQTWVYTIPSAPASSAAPADSPTSSPASSPSKTHVYTSVPGSSSDHAGISANASELVELMGTRKTFEGGRGKIAQEAKASILSHYPNCNREFLNEFTRRVQQQINPDDFADVQARVYAAHFTDNELQELIRWRRDLNAGKAASLPPALREKYRSSLVDIVSETAGGYAQVSARLGAELGEEIAKEHPEWNKPMAASH